MSQCITTKYLPCTNNKPSRVKAFCQAGSITLSWNHSLNTEDNHISAAKALIHKLDWDTYFSEFISGWDTKNQCQHVALPKEYKK